MNPTIRYPAPLLPGGVIAVTAPSSGIRPEHICLFEQAAEHAQELGFIVQEGAVLRSQVKLALAPAAERAAELQAFLLDDAVDAVMPPWGGEFLMEILPLMDWERLRKAPPKWMIGYSDTSTFLFAYTLITGCATAHGTNFVDLRTRPLDDVTARWMDVVGTAAGGTVTQTSSAMHQSAWDLSKPGFILDTPTRWRTIAPSGDSGDDPAISFGGRLIGGCLETLTTLIGTPYAPVSPFIRDYCGEEGTVWFLESSQRNAGDIHRQLWQMRECGWFQNCRGLLYGRPAGYAPAQDFELADSLAQFAVELGIPVVYNTDIGHVPPQLTLVNGALVAITAGGGSGTVSMSFR
ncbi:Muramoyltetrapeptide carboxypeptidase LdcA (peptidoglycan recycling) [Paenibacillus sophorae]|uniref:LD-carboxypeptidase n=1 Tax=Paenibacillus sophorae TaxID=1333845 RepID=A0A1H8ICN5_9BACL|nr:S66 peptidase family protein [Paenibacillus sophorae]QWU15918.1 LD-carboxypeptidase [Paenibacillus sophorae]SEN65925.1 Muramoyltetrapeptide carboxypeptidase LdcA (peptidoglycan recycling) [Paenibacillus sophorae]